MTWNRIKVARPGLRKSETKTARPDLSIGFILGNSITVVSPKLHHDTGRKNWCSNTTVWYSSKNVNNMKVVNKTGDWLYVFSLDLRFYGIRKTEPEMFYQLHNKNISEVHLGRNKIGRLQSGTLDGLESVR